MTIQPTHAAPLTDAEINWLAEEVLPSIRLTGSFCAPQGATRDETLDRDAKIRILLEETMAKLAAIGESLNELAERSGIAVPVLVGTSALITHLNQHGKTVST